MLLVERPATPFTFTTPPPLTQPLSFAPILDRFRSSLEASLKRTRAPCDVDNGTIARKKRRLRKSLITSRLSRPFSKPASHIVNRGNCKIAVWARQRHLGKIWLLKTAIMNSANRLLNGPVSNETLLTSARSLDLSLAAIESSATDEVRPTSVAPMTVGTDPRMSNSSVKSDSVTANCRKRRTSFEEDKAVHLASKPPKRRSMPVIERKMVMSTSPNMAPATHVRPSPLGLTDYNYDALDDDSYSGYDAAGEAETYEYTPHPDFVEKPTPTNMQPTQPVMIEGVAFCQPASALPSPSPSPPETRIVPPPSSFFGCDDQPPPPHLDQISYHAIPQVSFFPQPTSTLQLHPHITPPLHHHQTPNPTDLDFDFRTWLDHDSRPPSPPEEDILALLRGSPADQSYFF